MQELTPTNERWHKVRSHVLQAVESLNAAMQECPRHTDYEAIRETRDGLIERLDHLGYELRQ